MARWLSELRENLADDTIIHVVGLKADICAEDPARRNVPYERCIAYVAENFGANMTPLLGGSSVVGGDTPARVPTPRAEVALAGGHHADMKFGQTLGQALNGGKSGNAPPPLPSPHSNRSSGLWGQDLAWTWTSCHEVSASTGEGVDEVFRVITRRLVEQRNQRVALETAAATPGPGSEGGYFDTAHHRNPYGAAANGGSFRVGYGDKRRSWMGLPTFGSTTQEEGQSNTESRQWQSEVEGRRQKRAGRCC